mmetsp:Transcript_31694/g.51144  ORF Transcript_31694/g.51144 Transcript_31694/m.51144 type:complete len:299 (-) Transcript_31694:175-1071(-)
MHPLVRRTAYYAIVCFRWGVELFVVRPLMVFECISHSRIAGRVLVCLCVSLVLFGYVSYLQACMGAIELGASQVVITAKLVIGHIFILCPLIVSYVRAVSTTSFIDSRSESDVEAVSLNWEGKRRFCHHCNKYKPARAHHCRVCGRCTLRMDHHCPWLNNCVGENNHKFFLLFVGYLLVACAYVLITLWDSFVEALHSDRGVEDFSPAMNLVYTCILCTCIGVALMLFMAFHTMLVLTARTTIEFFKGTPLDANGLPTPNVNDEGKFKNFKAVFGPSPMYWLLPIANPSSTPSPRLLR